MIKIYVKKTSDYPISAVKIKKHLKNFLIKRGIRSDAQISVAIVGKNAMYSLVKKHLKGDTDLHNVLSFTESEIIKKFYYPPGEAIYLGEIVVCYPKAFEEAQQENKLIEDKIIELVDHGALHLLGVHHK